VGFIFCDFGLEVAAAVTVILGSKSQYKAISLFSLKELKEGYKQNQMCQGVKKTPPKGKEGGEGGQRDEEEEKENSKISVQTMPKSQLSPEPV
jgi:hypothetical protein